MTVRDLISHSTPPLRPNDPVGFALGLMLDGRVRHLPVVSGKNVLLGVLSEEQLLNATGSEVPVENLLRNDPVSIAEHMHVFSATKILLDHELTTLPVVSEEGSYLGLVRRHDLFDRFARMLSTQESGAIITLIANERDLVLSQIIYLIEQNDGKVLSLSTEKLNVEEGTTAITIKVNVKEVTRIRHLLEHNGYKVEAAFGEGDDPEELLDRVQEFLKYLEV